MRDDGVDLKTNELVSQPAETLWLALRRAEFERDVLSLYVAVLAQGGSEFAPKRFGVGRDKDPNSGRLLLLCACRERPRRSRAAERG